MIIYVGYYWLKLKCISFSVTWIKKKEKKGKYTLYFSDKWYLAEWRNDNQHPLILKYPARTAGTSSVFCSLPFSLCLAWSPGCWGDFDIPLSSFHVLTHISIVFLSCSLCFFFFSCLPVHLYCILIQFRLASLIFFHSITWIKMHDDRNRDHLS